MRVFMMGWLMISAAILTSGNAAAQTSDVEGHVFNKRSGVPIEGAVVVIYENVTSGPFPILLGEGVTDANGFYEVRIPTPTFPIGVIDIFCRTQKGVVVRGESSAPLREDVIRRRDIYLEVPRLLQTCLDPEPGDVPPFIRN